MKEYLLYGLAKNETESYMEDLLISSTDYNHIEKVKNHATKKGFHSFRESTYSGERPNFANTLNI